MDTLSKKKPGEPDWELNCHCRDCEYQRDYFNRTFEETQAIAEHRIANLKTNTN